MFSLRRCALAVSFALLSASISPAQTGAAPKSANPASEVGSQYTPRPQPAVLPNTRAAILRGAYGPYRANNDLLSYHLDIRVDPEKQLVSGKNTIRFQHASGRQSHPDRSERCLENRQDPARHHELKYQRDSGAVFIDFPEILQERAGILDRLLLFRASVNHRAASAASPSAKTPPENPGSSPPAKMMAQASGGPTRINGATKSKRWRSASRCPKTSSMYRTGDSWVRPIWAMDTRAGTGWSTTRSITTMSRSTSVTTSTSAISSAS